MDDRSALGFRVWDFSFRSLPRPYARAFLAEVMLRHPWRTMEGVREYRRFVRKGRHEGGIAYLFKGTEEEITEEMAGGELVVGVGFCSKPFACPAGRPNHTCTHFQSGTYPSGACEDCLIAAVGHKALLAGASMYIMTSAMDIAQDVMIPSIDKRRFKHFVLCLCPFSVQVILLPLLICGLSGYLFEYSCGDCRDYTQWLRADRGIKEARTAFLPEVYGKAMALLGAIASKRPAAEGYKREGNIYVPCMRTGTGLS